jgi:geranylgeranyl diphosphate synthase type I
VWDVWGTAHGINVGDGLFVLARLALHRLEQRISPERFQAAVLAFDEACMALCQGQFFDMTFEERLDVDLDQYLWMIRHKTAKLFAASTQLGALVATQNPAEIDAAYRFGANLGMAFQIQDDILGSWGDQGVTGKSTATDIRDKKKTLPIVYTLNHPHDRSLARRLRELYSQTQSLDEADIQAALTILRKAGAREHAEEIADQYYRKAIGHLDGLGFDNDARSCLQELAESLALRQA